MPEVPTQLLTTKILLHNNSLLKYASLPGPNPECCLHGISLTSPDKKGAITGWWNRSVRREVRRKVGKGRVGEGRREGSALSMTALKALDTV